LASPGFWNSDFAVLRQFTAREGRVKAQLRLEFYNVFNHANLSFPTAALSDPSFGQAYYGIIGGISRFGDLPLESGARRMQIGLRISF
jgi:hypothetical protein